VHLEGDPVHPRLFLAPAKDGGAPPRDDDSVDGAVASSASPPSRLAGGWRMGALAKQGQVVDCLNLVYTHLFRWLCRNVGYV
jgi:hypothetical protein